MLKRILDSQAEKAYTWALRQLFGKAKGDRAILLIKAGDLDFVFGVYDALVNRRYQAAWDAFPEGLRKVIATYIKENVPVLE